MLQILVRIIKSYRTSNLIKIEMVAGSLINDKRIIQTIMQIYLFIYFSFFFFIFFKVGINPIVIPKAVVFLHSYMSHKCF